MIVEKDEENEESKLPIYRHRQPCRDRRIKSRPKLTARITLINEETGHAGIKDVVSRKNAPSSQALHSLEMGEIFPEKMAQKVRRHLP